jgi:hypothetical protein
MGLLGVALAVGLHRGRGAGVLAERAWLPRWFAVAVGALAGGAGNTRSS